MLEMQTNIRVNAGCGSSPTPGWVNFDNSFSIRATHWPLVVPALVRLRLLGGPSADLARAADAKNIQFANATARIPCASNSVSAVYSSHMIEHLDRGEAAEILREAGAVVVPPEDDAALAGAIRELAADPERRAVMGQAGRRHVENSYDRRALAREYRKVLDSAGDQP